MDLKVLNVSSVFIFNFCVFPYFLPYNCRYFYDSGIIMILAIFFEWYIFFRCNKNIDTSTTLVRPKSSSALYHQQLQVYTFYFSSYLHYYILKQNPSNTFLAHSWHQKIVIVWRIKKGERWKKKMWEGVMTPTAIINEEQEVVRLWRFLDSAYLSFSDTYFGGKVKRSEINKAKQCKVDYFKHAEKRMWPVSLFWRNVIFLIERGSFIKVYSF